MRKIAFAAVLSLVGASLVCAEAALTIGTNAEMGFEVPNSIGLEPFLAGTLSATVPLSAEWSALADASTRIGYGVPGQGFTWFGYGAADLTWRDASTFAKLGATGSAEGDATGSVPSVAIASDTEISIDFAACSISFAPTVRWRFDGAQRLEVEGVLAGIFSSGESAVTQASLSAGVDWPQEGSLEWQVGARVGFSWYLAAPIVLSLDAELIRSIASNSSTISIDSVTVSIPAANSFLEVSLAPELSGSLARGLRLRAVAPCAYRISDHGAIIEASVSAEPQWLLSASPSISLQFALSDWFSATATCGAELRYSNSAYLASQAGYFTVKATLALE
jgi:hypothetical protein